MRIKELFEPSVIEESMSTRMKLAYRNFVDSRINKSLFHMTSGDNAASIINGDMIDGSYSSDAPFEPKSIMRKHKKYISFATRRHNAFSRAVMVGTRGKYHVLFELDGKSLISDYESLNVNFWEEVAKEEGRSSFDSFLSQEMNEHEVRLFTGRKGVTPLSKYVKTISILISKKELTKKDLKNLDMISQKFNDVKFFSTYSDFVSGSNSFKSYKDFL